MNPQVCPIRNRWYVRLFVPPAAAVGGLLLRLALERWVGPGLPTFVTFYPVVMFVAVVAGFWPGALATAASALLVDYYVLVRGSLFTVEDIAGVTGMILFVSMGLLMSWVAGSYRHMRNRLEELVSIRTRELSDAYAALKQQVELVDSARAEVIAREMQRVLRARREADTPRVAPESVDFRRVPSVAGMIVAAAGLLALAGWMWNVDALKSVALGWVTMKANTAFCFVLAGTALLLREQRAIRTVCAAAVGVAGALVLAEYAVGANLHFDQVLFHDPGDAQTAHPGLMAPATALGFVFASLSLLCLRTSTMAGRLTSQFPALFVGLIGLISVMGYAYGIQDLYRIGGGTSMALNTALVFVALAVGLIFAQADGWVGALVGPGVGAEFARRLLPAVFFIPLLFGWLCEQGVVYGWFSDRLGVALFTLLIVPSFVVLIWWIASRLGRAEASRRAIEMQLRNQTQLMDQSRDAFIVREENGVIHFWNTGAVALYGWSAAEALGQRIHVLLKTEGLPADHEAHLEKTIYREGELVRTTRDGRRVVVESRKTAMRDTDGRIFILENNRDITERKRADEELRRIAEDLVRSNKDLEQFAYVASHDLQEPLRAVAGFMSLLKKQYREQLDAGGKEYIDLSIEGAERMQALIHDLLTYSQVGTKGFTREPIHLRDAVDGALRNLQLAVAENNVKIVCDPLPTVTADLPQMIQLFQNLIGNAIKFRRPGAAPEVRIRAERATEAAAWRVFVRDNGVGIEPQYFARIFLIFQRLHGRTQYKGSGIGLAVCKKIVERHGGTIGVESVPGEGSTFYFIIPDKGGENP